MKLRILILPLLLGISLGVIGVLAFNNHTAPVVRHHHKTTPALEPPSFSGQCILDATGVVGVVLRNLGEPGVNNYLNSAQILLGGYGRIWQAIQSGISAGAPVMAQQGYVKGINAALTALTSVCQGGLG